MLFYIVLLVVILTTKAEDDDARRMCARPTVFPPQIGKRYLTYAEIKALACLLEKRNPTRVKVTIYGKSIEGRNLLQVKIALNLDEEKPALRVVAGASSRDWIGIAVAANLLNELANDTVEGNTMLEKYDWYIYPCINPDGYHYSHRFKRFWIKNRRPPIDNGKCFGTNLERNWNISFGDYSASSNQCSEVYTGTHPFSEPETLALKNVVESANDKFAFFSFESFGNILSIPYGYTDDQPPNYRELTNTAVSMAEAFQHVRGTDLQVKSYGQGGYLVSGTSLDYMYEVLNISYSMVFQLGNGYNGFEVPTDDIFPVFQETFNALKAFTEMNTN